MGIKGLWSLKQADRSPYDKFLVQAFVGETRILSIEDNELAEVRTGFNLFCELIIIIIIIEYDFICYVCDAMH